MFELIGSVLVGALITFLAVNWNLYLVHQSFKKESFRILNHNLSKIQRYWSLEQGQVIEIAAGLEQSSYQQQDYQKSTRAAFLFGTVMIFLSWAGLVIFLVYFVSIHKFVKTRMEARIFSSELVSNPNLQVDEVSSLLLEMENLG